MTVIKRRSLTLLASIGLTGILFLAAQHPAVGQEVAVPAASEPLPPVSGVKMEILSLPTSVTGSYARLLQDLGQSAEPLMALLFYPEKGINQYSPGVVFHHGGIGGHPARSTDAARFAAERLAQKGYTVLSIYSRHARHHRTIRFEEAALDIQTGLDFLTARGMEELILAGHGMGSTRTIWYQATAQDPRVKAMVHFAPAGDLHGEDSLVDALGAIEDYDEKVDRALKAIASGRGGADRGTDEGKLKGLDPDEWIYVGDGVVQTPEAFLSFWGPGAPTRISDWIARVNVPVLMLAGTEDKTVPPGRLQQLAEQAKASTRADYRLYDGGNHFFEGVWDESVADTVAWLREVGVEPKSRITTEIVDIPMGDGRHRAGILYLPEGGADADKPLFLLKHGWTGDIVHSSNHWLGWRLAVEGYAVLAPETRISGAQGIQKVRLAEVAEDLGRWIDFLDSRGFDQVIMEGHSAGGIWISNYLSESQDPRVIGMVYLAPTRDMPQMGRAGLGADKYAEVVREAKAAIARGEGDSYLINHKYYPVVEERFGTPRSVMLQTADIWLEYWGPDSRAVHTERVSEFDRPSLTIAGYRDGLMSMKFIKEFTRAHKGKAEYKWYLEGSHGLRESKSQVLSDIVEWTQRTFPQP